MGAVAAALVTANRRSGVKSWETAPVFLRSSDLQLTCSLDKADVQRLRRIGINALTLSSQLHIQLQGNTTLTRNDTLTTNWQELDPKTLTTLIMEAVSNSGGLFNNLDPQDKTKLRELTMSLEGQHNIHTAV